MRLSLLLQLALCLCFGAAFGRLAGAEADAAFAEGNRRFEAGDYEGAASLYEALAGEGRVSAELFYNLGAAKHRIGESGEAALWMRRALLVEPGMPEARQSLRHLRAQFAWLEFSEGGVRGLLASIGPASWRWTLVFLVWGGLLLLVAALALPALRAKRSGAVTLGFVLLMTAFVVSRLESYRDRNLAVQNFATVVARETSALAAPAPDAKAVVALPPGSELRILQKTGPWNYAEIPGGLRGWVRSTSVVGVWPAVAGGQDGNRGTEG